MTTTSTTSDQGKPAPLLACDIVMAGGVTSGIIYPGAVAMIARHYSFQAIGGTSVGAIAAAATAAAEYGRRTKSNPNAFDGLAALPDQLGSRASDDRSRLFHLFTPEGGGTASEPGPDTRGLLALATPLVTAKGPLGKLAGLARFAWATPVIRTTVAVTGAIALLTVGRLIYGGQCLVVLIVLLPFLCLILCAALAALGYLLARKWLPAWRQNGYGICTGNSNPNISPGNSDAAPFEGLTPWVHRVVQTAAGRSIEDPPLTFGDLWTAPPAASAVPADSAPPARSIELAMITSDISRNRAAQLPFLEAPSDLYVEEAMLCRYFPKSIVDWMRKHRGDDDDRIAVPDGVFHLPKPENLPIVFAARLSLSFPVLLSAVPLLTPDYANAKGGNRKIALRPVWYSDGGLTSNFPIHFFDSPIPSRPTFCLNLVDFDSELAPQPPPRPSAKEEENERTPAERESALSDATREAEKAIARPHARERTAAARPMHASKAEPKPGDPVWEFVSMSRRNAMAPASFTTFDKTGGIGLVAFLATLVNTARFWADNQMLIAPGTRDRVVHIALREDEGGLNLDMPARTIGDLDLRGRAAGMLIAARFGLRGTIDPEIGKAIAPAFPNHRWVRYRNFMAAFERLARRFADARRRSDAGAAERGELPIDAMITGKPREIGYPAPDAAKAYYKQTTDDLESLALRMMQQAQTFDPPKGPGSAPRPKMRVNLRPQADNDPLA